MRDENQYEENHSRTDLELDLEANVCLRFRARYLVATKPICMIALLTDNYVANSHPQ